MISFSENEDCWFKGVLHVHSNKSDGKLSIKDLCRFYRKNGYDFISITDHGLANYEQFNDDNFIVIPGIEIGAKTPTNKGLHLVGIDISRNLVIPESRKVQDRVDMICRSGGEVIVAHPYESSLEVNDLLSFSDYLGIEVFNTFSHRYSGLGFSRVLWDLMLRQGKRVFGFAGDDSHFDPVYFGGFDHDALGGWLMVKAERLDRESIMKSLKKGYFYSSIGPEFVDFRMNNKTLYLKTSPIKAISFLFNNPGYNRRFEKQKGVFQEYQFELLEDKGNIIVEIEDYTGKKAWLNP